MPYPTIPANLPKTKGQLAPNAIKEEVEGQDALAGVNSHKPVKKKGVKRKLGDSVDDERDGLARSVSRRLDFTS